MLVPDDSICIIDRRSVILARRHQPTGSVRTRDRCRPLVGGGSASKIPAVRRASLQGGLLAGHSSGSIGKKSYASWDVLPNLPSQFAQFAQPKLPIQFEF